MTDYHVPALLESVLVHLAPKPGEVLVDGTLGGGGHSEAILRCLEGSGRLIGIDQDPEALRAAGLRLASFPNFTAVRGNFSQIDSLLESIDVDLVDGILLDLGVSSHQLDAGERGFSFRFEAPLDMRMNPELTQTAADLVAGLSLDELTEIIRDYGEEKFARRIASRIVQQRELEPILTTTALANLVKDVVPAVVKYGRIHPATKTFQALRMAVNDELGALRRGISAAIEHLRPNGRLAIISYHSLEDRMVKTAFRDYQGVCTCPPRAPVCTCHPQHWIEVVTRKPVLPDEREVQDNPRARSAKLRVARRLDN